MTDSRSMFGRRVIYTDVPVIDESNLLPVLADAFATHNFNRGEIQYLFNYYKGKQPVLERTKDIRPEINNKIVVNRANEIVNFKVGYTFGEPIAYVNRTGENDVSDAINTLNEYVFSEDKAAKDKELAEWMMICGTSFRMILPDASGEEDEAPFELHTLDPRNTFVVYWSGLGNPALMGVHYITLKDGTNILYCYTKDKYFEVRAGKIIASSGHTLGGIPIIEYPANTARLGSFEIVLPLLDAVNEVASNRIDGVEQFIQSLLVMKGVDIDAEDFANLKQYGGIKVPVDGDVNYLLQELNQGSTQTLVDDLYETILTIVGMPSTGNGKTSDSSNNGAVVLKNGWQGAETRAKEVELQFKQSEKTFLKMLINICNTLRGTSLKLSNIEIRFTRRNYENISEKTNVLISMLSNDKIHPRLAFEHCGLFVDPDVAYAASEEYYEEQKREMERTLVEEDSSGAEDDGDSSSAKEDN